MTNDFIFFLFENTNFFLSYNYLKLQYQFFPSQLSFG